jgi:hypothetical protein
VEKRLMIGDIGEGEERKETDLQEHFVGQKE